MLLGGGLLYTSGMAQEVYEHSRYNPDLGCYNTYHYYLNTQNRPVLHGSYEECPGDSGEYAHGQRVGTWRWWAYPGGLTVDGVQFGNNAEGQYYNNLREGLWKNSRSDTTYWELTYRAGIPHGPFRSAQFFEGAFYNGRLHGPITYDNWGGIIEYDQGVKHGVSTYFTHTGMVVCITFAARTSHINV